MIRQENAGGHVANCSIILKNCIFGIACVEKTRFNKHDCQ